MFSVFEFPRQVGFKRLHGNREGSSRYWWGDFGIGEGKVCFLQADRGGSGKGIFAGVTGSERKAALSK